MAGAEEEIPLYVNKTGAYEWFSKTVAASSYIRSKKKDVSIDYGKLFLAGKFMNCEV
ncbi:hypothetical protein HanRHA438_Chr09g0405361 [Helianthus annuus]|nr:hypothetical protein HanRHA438_Chr09g0405361 [Helianthus annuus]